MFTFIPQLLIVLSIAGIIFIVVRKTPEVSRLADKARPSLKRGLLKFWHFVLEVKGLKGTGRFIRIPKSLPRIHLPKARLPHFWGPQDSLHYFLKQGEESLEREDYDGAERWFIKAIEKDPLNETAYADLGKIYLAQKKYKEAIEIYKFLVKHYPESDSHFSNLGQAYHSQRLYARAVEAYERSIALAPQNPRRFVNLGLTLEAQKHLEEAILNYRRAADLESSNTQFLMILAEALIKKSEMEEAELILEKILQLEPTNHLAREKLMELKY